MKITIGLCLVVWGLYLPGLFPGIILFMIGGYLIGQGLVERT